MRARLAALALLVACSENSNTPMSPTEVGPQFAIVTTVNPANAPSGAHFAAGTSSSCAVASLTVTCNAYELAGLGNTNADAVLALNFSATVTCTNHGGQLVEVKTQFPTTTFARNNLRTKNGRLTVPQLTNSGEVPSDNDFERQANCPNGNWTKHLVPGSISFTFAYSLTFAGFASPFILITGP